MAARAAPPPYTPSETPARSVNYLPSGATLLDLVLGGGYGEGRIVNIVGDRAAGKTLLAIEACANFAHIHGVENCCYAEAEAAFDEDYAQIVGMPSGIQRVGGVDDEMPMRTIEQFAEHLLKFIKERDKKRPCLYILDSLDALSDEGEQERDLGDATYGTAKAKLLSEFFRKHVDDIAHARVTLMIVSQIRDKIGVTFGETKTRSGGHALNFYASQIIWLAEVEKLKRQIRGIDRVYGSRVLVNCKKNKVGLAYRTAEVTIRYNYGMDDEDSMLRWLAKAKQDKQLSMSVDAFKEAVAAARQEGNRAALLMLQAELATACKTVWDKIEADLAPTIRKYQE